MKRIKLASVLLVVFVVMAFAVYAAQEKRSIVMVLTLPNGSAPQLRILEGETGTVSMPEVGKYGFVPTLKDASVIVDVIDLNRTPGERLGRVEAVVGGDEVRSDTSPQFGVRVIRVVTE